MKKSLLGLILLSSLFAGSAFAQSSVRADEAIKNPESYRLGDSNDLASDQLHVDQIKVCNDEKKAEFRAHQDKVLRKHLIKNGDYI